MTLEFDLISKRDGKKGTPFYVIANLTKNIVRSGIRTHAHSSGLRPEHSALDLSAILTDRDLNHSGV